MSALLAALLIVGAVDGLTQAAAGWRVAAVSALATLAALAGGHGLALEIGLLGYTQPLLGVQALDTAAWLTAWAIAIMLSLAVPVPAHPVKSALAAIPKWLPSPPWLLAVLLMQALAYQSVDGVPYVALAAVIGGIAVLAMLIAGWLGSHQRPAQPTALLRPASSAALLAIAVWLTGTNFAASAVEVNTSLDSFAVLLVIALVLAGFGASRRRWL